MMPPPFCSRSLAPPFRARTRVFPPFYMHMIINCLTVPFRAGRGRGRPKRKLITRTEGAATLVALICSCNNATLFNESSSRRGRACLCVRGTNKRGTRNKRSALKRAKQYFRRYRSRMKCVCVCGCVCICECVCVCVGLTSHKDKSSDHAPPRCPESRFFTDSRGY